jgi:hypothetical protein
MEIPKVLMALRPRIFRPGTLVTMISIGWFSDDSRVLAVA